MTGFSTFLPLGCHCGSDNIQLQNNEVRSWGGIAGQSVFWNGCGLHKKIEADFNEVDVVTMGASYRGLTIRVSLLRP